MNKNLIAFVTRFIAVVVFLILSCGIIWAAGNGTLPFYERSRDESSRDEMSGSVVSIPEISTPPEVSVVEPIDFSAYLINISEKSNYPDHKLSDKVYDKTNTVFAFAKKSLPANGIISIVPRMGFLFLTKSDGGVSLLDANGEVIFEQIPEGYEFAGVRDFQNRPLFKLNNQYYFLNGKNFNLGSYTAIKDDRGINFDYPSYYGASNGKIEKYRYNNSWGLRYIGGSAIVVYPGYQEVFHYSEGYAVANYYGNLIIFDSRPLEVARGFLPPLTRGIESLGYFYFDHGLMRVRKMAAGVSTEGLIYKDFTSFMLPADFELVCYYNGVLTLKKGDRYGYMKHTGEWLVNANLSAASPFIEGVASYRNAEGKYGMIALDGKALLPPVFDYISDCSGGVIVAYEKEQGYFIINKLVLETSGDAEE